MRTDLLVGTVQSGGTIRALPLADVRVSVYETTAHAPLAAGTTKTDAAGRFSLGPSRTTSDSVFYATASRRELGLSLKGLSLDSQGNAWIASGGEDAVYLLSPGGEPLGKFSGSGISSPWSATVDGDDDVWVANFCPMSPGSDYTSAAISKLAGIKGPKTGDPISPSTGYTLPSAGSQVLLHNGDPLYGPGRPPSFCPLMRQTNCVIDQAGNVWAMNNWKPNFDVDIAGDKANPGGDGIVISVGLAKPPTKKH